MATNGQERTAAAITADVVKKQGLDLANDIRKLGAEAKQDGEALAAYAEEQAAIIIKIAEEAASRIAEWLRRSANARESIQDHADKLTDLPDKSEIIPVDPRYAEIQAKIQNKAFEEALLKRG